jgi:hypothetical protein
MRSKGRFPPRADDLRGELGAGVICALGEVGVAGAAAGDRGEQVLVVAKADTDRRGGNAAALGAGGEVGETVGVDHPDVGVTVGEQD